MGLKYPTFCVLHSNLFTSPMVITDLPLHGPADAINILFAIFQKIMIAVTRVFNNASKLLHLALNFLEQHQSKK